MSGCNFLCLPKSRISSASFLRDSRFAEKKCYFSTWEPRNRLSENAWVNNIMVSPTNTPSLQPAPEGKQIAPTHLVRETIALIHLVRETRCTHSFGSGNSISLAKMTFWCKSTRFGQLYVRNQTGNRNRMIRYFPQGCRVGAKFRGVGATPKAPGCNFAPSKP